MGLKSRSSRNSKKWTRGRKIRRNTRQIYTETGLKEGKPRIEKGGRRTKRKIKQNLNIQGK